MIPGLTDCKIRKIRELRKQKMKRKDIAKKFSLTERQVAWVLSKRFRSNTAGTEARAKKSKRTPYRFPEEKTDEIVDMWRNHFSYGMMTAKTGIRYRSIVKKLRELALID